MKITTLREFRDHASRMFRSKEPILITRRGRLAGIFLPSLSETLPLEIKREIFAQLSAAIGRQLKRRGLAEAEVLEDFEDWRMSRRGEARR